MGTGRLNRTVHYPHRLFISFCFVKLVIINLADQNKAPMAEAIVYALDSQADSLIQKAGND